jgi:hypothetical protein
LPPFPNPTAGSTRIQWEVARPVPVKVEVFTVSGRRVFSRTVPAAVGTGRLDWDGKDRHGRRMPSGVYLVAVRAGGEQLGKRTVVLRR